MTPTFRKGDRVRRILGFPYPSAATDLITAGSQSTGMVVKHRTSDEEDPEGTKSQ